MLILPHLKGLPAGNAGSNTFKSSALDLNFAVRKSLVDSVSGNNLVTFTRASSATYTDSSGVLRSAVTNLLLRSEEFDNASWTKNNLQAFGSGSVANATIAPNGTLTADKIVENTATSQHMVFQNTTPEAGKAYVLSFYAKAAERTFVTAAFSGGGLSTDCRFGVNLNTGEIVSGSTAGSPELTQVTPIGDGWYRLALIKTMPSASGLQPRILMSTNGTAQSYLGDGTSGLFIWGAQLEQSSTVGEYIPTTSTINSAPRFDHNPTTGESLGLMGEEARTNSVTNNTMVGAVAGTPGTAPTGWPFQVASNGLAVSIVGTGTESGIAYLDWRISGTATAAATGDICFGRGSALTAQTWTISSYLRLVSGSLSGVTGATLSLIEETAASVFVTGGLYSIALPTNASLITQRPAVSRTLTGGATVALVRTNLTVNVSSGSTVDFTLRIGLPQLEQGAFATSVIPTTTATVTRAADVASITGSNFSSWYNQTEGTVFVDGSTPAFTGTTGFVAINAGGSTNRLDIRQSRNQPTVNGAATGITWTQVIPPPTFVANTSYKQATAVSNASHGNSISGSLDTSSTTIGTIAATQLIFGMRDSQTAPTGGSSSTIKRLTFWPTRLADTTLQQITQP